MSKKKKSLSAADRFFIQSHPGMTAEDLALALEAPVEAVREALGEPAKADKKGPPPGFARQSGTVAMTQGRSAADDRGKKAQKKPFDNYKDCIHKIRPKDKCQ